MAGHVRRRGKGWQARLPDPSRGGTAKLERTFRTKVEAEQWLAVQASSIVRGEFVDPGHAAKPFAELVDAWRSTLVRIGPVTRAGYDAIVRAHIEPAWAKTKVGDINHGAVQKWVTELSAGGLAPNTVRNAFAVLRQVFRAAERLGLVRSNPCEGVRLPRAAHREMLFLDADEVRALAEAITPHYRTLVYAAAYTGLRWGELAALRRRDLDLLRGVVYVRGSLKEVDGALTRGPTKTHTHRTVALPTFLRELLAEPVPPGPGADALVFTTRVGAPLRRQNFARRHWRPAVEAALPVDKHGLRFHDLRHTCASLLVAAGVHPKAIQSHLGHSSIQVTLDRYAHLLPSVEQALAAALDATHAAASAPAANVVELRG